MLEKNYAVLSGAMVVAASWLAGCSHSNEMPPAASPETTTTYERQSYTPPEDIRRLDVVVQDVDRDNHTVTFKAQVLPEMNLMRNGHPIKVDQLKKGDGLRVYADTRTGEIIRVDAVEQPAPATQ